MIYYTIKIEIEEKLSPSDLLKEMRDGATHWGQCIGKQPKKREKIQKFGNNYYMKVAYES